MKDEPYKSEDQALRDFIATCSLDFDFDRMLESNFFAVYSESTDTYEVDPSQNN